MDQIKKLHREKPIKTELDGSMPMSVDDLATVLDRLADYDYESNPTTKAELKDSLGQLIAHYESEIFLTSDYDSSEGDTLPLTVGDIKSVYNHLAEQDGGLFVF